MFLLVSLLYKIILPSNLQPLPQRKSSCDGGTISQFLLYLRSWCGSPVPLSGPIQIFFGAREESSLLGGQSVSAPQRKKTGHSKKLTGRDDEAQAGDTEQKQQQGRRILQLKIAVLGGTLNTNLEHA